MTTYEHTIRQWNEVADGWYWYELARLHWIKDNRVKYTPDPVDNVLLSLGGKADFTLFIGSQSIDLTEEHIEELIEELERHDLLRAHDDTLSQDMCDGCDPSWICEECDKVSPEEIASWITDNLPEIMSEVMDKVMDELRDRDITDIMVREARGYIRSNACIMRGRL